MKKRIIVLVMIVTMLVTACGNTKQSCHCTCGGCCCQSKEGNATIEIEDADEVLGLLPESTVEHSVVPESTESEVGETMEESVETVITVAPDLSEPITESEIIATEVVTLTEGEKQARRELMAQLATQRETLYMLPNSIEKTNQIAQIDAMIVENNAYDFSDSVVNFIGDSITEGVGGQIAEDGSKISYVNYVQEYLNIGQAMNRGMAGRMFSDYGRSEYSFSVGMKNILFTTSDVTVIFLGVNDYLSESEGKRFGDQDKNAISTAGFCGALRQVLNCLDLYFGEQEVFFVLTYNIGNEVNATYTDLDYTPTQADFMNIIESYVSDRGYHIIDLYNTGFLDASDEAICSAYLTDGVHPNNSGYILLGQHIAAEIALVMSNQ